jgi:VWFA-related protein
MKRFRWFIPLLWCIAAASTAQGFISPQDEPGQNPAAAPTGLIPRSHEEREARYRAIHHIILNVLAVDDFKLPVTGLKPQDLVLMDNGRPQELATFREVKGDQGIAPPHIFLILDAVNSTGRSIADDEKEIGKYLELNQGRLTYPTSVATFTYAGIKASRTSLDGSSLIEDSKSLFKDLHPYTCKSSSDDTARPLPLTGHGDRNISLSIQKIDDGNCMNEKFTLSVRALSDFAAAQLNVLGRVIVIWIGPGWPLLTGPEFQPDTAEIKANFFDHIVQLSRTLREAQVTVDAVDSPEMFRKPELQSLHAKPFAEGPLTETQATASDLALQAIAIQSGGRVSEGKSIVAQIGRCVTDLQTYYALSFESPPSSKPDEYHSVHVEVNKSGVKAFTNTLYYGEP